MLAKLSIPFVLGSIWLAGCEVDEPAPQAEPVRKPVSQTVTAERPATPIEKPADTSAPRAATANDGKPPGACCGSSMCQRVPGGCGCRAKGNANANCGG